jgi:hypothetical protein
MSERRTLEYMDLDDLYARFHPKNPKDHDIGELRASFKRFGYVEPIVVDERTGRLASGHGRVTVLMADRQLGITEPNGVDVVDGRWLAPVVRGWVSKDDDELLAYVIAANRLTETGGWLKGLLTESVIHLADTPGGLLGIGFDSDDLVKFLASSSPPDSFLTLDPDSLATAYRCPSCGYAWSGKPKPNEDEEDDDEQSDQVEASQDAGTPDA